MIHGCPNKYQTYASTVEDLKCKKIEIARVWEDNRHVLVPDQKDLFGCINLQCCDQVNQIIEGRFDLLLVADIFLIFYLLIFIMNLQYMGNTICRYNARLLNHKGDWISMTGIIAVTCVFLLTKQFYDFPQLASGPPVVEFEKIIPAGQELQTYYNL